MFGSYISQIRPKCIMDGRVGGRLGQKGSSPRGTTVLGSLERLQQQRQVVRLEKTVVVVVVVEQDEEKGEAEHLFVNLWRRGRGKELG